MQNPRPRRSFLILSVLLLCLAPPGFAQRKIRVAAASDLQTVMPQIARSFTEKTHVNVELTYGSSGNFFAQIQNGAPFDVFFSADSEFPSRLIQSNLADPSSSVVYGVGSLVLWLPSNSKCDPQTQKWDCLLQPAVSRIALANPAHAPYGRAAVLALQSARVYEKVRSKFVLGENIAQAAQFVQSGNAQAAILAHPQMLSPALQRGKRWEIPRDSYPAIEQTVVILKSAKDQSAAQDFIAFVTTGPGRALLEQAGFQPPPAAPPSRESHK